MFQHHLYLRRSQRDDKHFFNVSTMFITKLLLDLSSKCPRVVYCPYSLPILLAGFWSHHAKGRETDRVTSMQCPCCSSPDTSYSCPSPHALIRIIRIRPRRGGDGILPGGPPAIRSEWWTLIMTINCKGKMMDTVCHTETAVLSSFLYWRDK